MENRRNIRNWDAFGTLYRFAARMLAAELLEPVLKFVFDLSAALLLGVTFIFQSLSVLIALDVVVLSFYQVSCTYLCGILSALMFFIASERERIATVRSLMKYVFNIMWVKIIYSVHPDCWVYMSGGPIFAGALMHTLIGFYTERLNTDQSTTTQVLYSLFLFSLFLIVFNTIFLAPDHVLLETVFLLRCPIDTLCNSVDTIFKICDSALGVDGKLPVYTTQIARYSFWSSVHLLQFLHATTMSDSSSLTTRRADKYIYFFLFMHDLLELAVPVRHLLVQVMNERYITKTFPKLTAVELSAVAEETCPVCLSEHSRDTVRLRCNHLLHAGCLHNILTQNAGSHQHSRCPMCRADIEITPPNSPLRRSGSSGGIFGAGMRGLRARSTNRQQGIYRSLAESAAAARAGSAGTIQASAGGRFGTAEQLISDHLMQHNLQQGDVIHIRIIPRAAAASAAALSSADMPFNAATASSTATQTPADTTTRGPSQIALDAQRAIELHERSSVLGDIHAHGGLYSESESSTPVPLDDAYLQADPMLPVAPIAALAVPVSSAMDVDDVEVEAEEEAISHEQLERMIQAAMDAVHDEGSNSESTTTNTTNTTNTTTITNIENTFPTSDDSTFPATINIPAITATADLPTLSHFEALECTQVDTQFDGTQFDTENFAAHIILDEGVSASSENSDSSDSSDSSDNSDSEDSDDDNESEEVDDRIITHPTDANKPDTAEEFDEESTAHSSQSDELSVDLYHFSRQTPSNDTAHHDSTGTPTISDGELTPVGIKRKHAVIDLISPTQSPEKEGFSASTPSKQESARKLPRVMESELLELQETQFSPYPQHMPDHDGHNDNNNDQSSGDDVSNNQ